MDDIDDMIYGSPEDIVLRLDEILSSPKYSSKEPPNDEMARAYEWKVVMLDILLETDANKKLVIDCTRAAKRAEEYSSTEPYPAYDPKSFYPILARDAMKTSLPEGIHYYNLAQDEAKVRELEKELAILDVFDAKEPKDEGGSKKKKKKKEKKEKEKEKEREEKEEEKEKEREEKEEEKEKEMENKETT